MQHREIGLSELFPADKDSSEAIHPAVGPLHDPASGPEAWISFDALGFFASCSDVGGEAELVGKIADFGEIVALVHADPAPFHGNWSGHLDGLYRFFKQFEVVAVGTVNDHCDRNSLGFGQETAFDTLFAPIRRISTRFFDPDKGALLIAPSTASHDQSIPST